MARRATRPAAKAAPPPPPKQLRTVARSGKNAAPRGVPARKLDLDGLSAEQKVTLLLRERENLLTQLTAAQAKVSALEGRESHLADRIAWALDTLNDLLREAG